MLERPAEGCHQNMTVSAAPPCGTRGAYGRLEMNLQKYTEKAQEAVQAALSLATEYNNTQIEPEHLLLALLQQDGGVVPTVLERLNVSVDSLARHTRSEIERLARLSGGAAEPVLAEPLN